LGVGIGVPGHLFRLGDQVKFLAKRHLDSGSEFREAAGAELNLAPTHPRRRRWRGPISPLDGEANRPAAWVLGVDVSPLAVDAADVSDDREPLTNQRVDGQCHGHAFGRNRCT
jgi:hypothetical protein